MIDFFLLSANTPFVIALALMIAFTAIEIVSASMGMGLSELVDSLLPEFDADIDIDADADIADGGGATGSLAALLAWFRIGEVPVIMLLIVFLTGFGLSGIIVQFMMVSIFGFTVPTLIAVPLALVAAVPTVRFCGGLLGKYMPKDETYAVAEIGKPAEAKVKDKHGQTHYIRVEPDKQAYRFEQGEEGLIVSKDGSIYISKFRLGFCMQI